MRKGVGEMGMVEGEIRVDGWGKEGMEEGVIEGFGEEEMWMGEYMVREEV